MRMGAALQAATVGEFFSAMTPQKAHLLLKTDDLNAVALEIYNDRREYVGRIVLPRAVWVAASQPTVLESIGDFLRLTWSWIVKWWVVVTILLAITMWMMRRLFSPAV